VTVAICRKRHENETSLAVPQLSHPLGRPHIQRDRVIYSADVSQRLGGNVTRRLYPNMGHTINADELDVVRELMAGLVAQPDPAVVR
jgi:hypothetical protein